MRAILVTIFNFQESHLGSKKGLQFWSDWVVRVSESLIGESLAENSARETLGVPSIPG
jgi:hypothetical protein